MPAPYKVLFICTGNCCRSQMAEALLKHLGRGRFEAFSAGASPAGYVHPLALEAMERMNIPADGQYSKSWDEFADADMDIIITLCDHAAGAPCPVWPGHPVTAHWSTPDPSFMPGTDEERIQNALAVASTLRRWIQTLVELPLDDLTPEHLSIELNRITLM